MHEHYSDHSKERNKITIIVNDDDDIHYDHRLERLIVEQGDRIIHQIQKAVDDLMLNLDALNAAVATETTVDQSIIALVNAIAGQLQELIASGNVNEAAIQEVVDQITANSTAISEAVIANTPVEPPPVEPPVG